MDATADLDGHTSFADASYGAPSTFDAEPTSSLDAAYGAPPTFDAGPDAAGGDADTD